LRLRSCQAKFSEFQRKEEVSPGVKQLEKTSNKLVRTFEKVTSVQLKVRNILEKGFLVRRFSISPHQLDLRPRKSKS